MKYIIYLFLLIPFFSDAQKNDYIWLTGHTHGLSEGTWINFNHAPPSIEIIEIEMFFIVTNASFCNESGELLMYTNGLYIANRLGEMMENSDSLNAGAWADASGDIGYLVSQGAFFLEKPGDPNIVYLLHTFLDYFSTGAPLTRLYYTLIDLSYNNGLGKVIEKNVPLLTGDELLNYDQATAVRHANGRDWWIVVPNHMQPEYFRFLLTPEGIEGPWAQEIGFKEPTDNWWDYSFGHRVFSPDGGRFVDYDFFHYIQVFDFDRCTGLLSNPIKIDYEPDSMYGNAGSAIAFSPSGRFIYISRANQGYDLVQYDLDSPDIPGSELVLWHCEDPSPFNCGIGNMLLAPDNKIYIASGDSLSYYIVHEPDSLGMASGFEENGLTFPLPHPNDWFPYFPNYRLGALEGSPCDTIETVGTTGAYSFSKIFVYPNPAGDYVFFDNSRAGEMPSRVLFYNNMGEVVFEKKWAHNMSEYKMDVSGLAAGIYFYTVYGEERVLKSGKIIVQREY